MALDAFSRDLFNVGVKITADTSGVLKGFSDTSNGLKKLSSDFKTFGRSLSDVSRTLTFFGASVTGAFGTAFAKARTDVPAVDRELQRLGNSFQAMSDVVAVSALPTLQQFTGFMNQLAVFIGTFVERHQELINQFLKYSALTVIVGTFGFVSARLIRTFSSLITLSIQFGGVVLGLFSPIGLVTAAVIGLVAALLLLDDKFKFLKQQFPSLSAGFIGVGAAIQKALSGQGGGGTQTSVLDDFRKLTSGLKDEFDKLMKDWENSAGKTQERITSLVEEFGRGFRSVLNTLRENVNQFGVSVAQSFERAFGDTIFNAITFRIESLKEVFVNFANDVGRALSRLAANELLARLFGDKEGTREGLFGGLGALFGRGGGGGRRNDPSQQARELARNFDGLSDNMRKFGIAKDDVIRNFRRLERTIEELTRTFRRFGRQAEEAQIGGGAGAGEGQASAAAEVATLGTEGTQQVDTFNASLGTTVGLVGAIGAGFQNVIGLITQMGAVYTIVSTLMLGLAIAGAAATRAIVAPLAASIAAAWFPAAVFASIATLGAAVPIGLAALAGGVAVAQGLFAAFGGVQGGQGGGGGGGEFSVGGFAPEGFGGFNIPQPKRKKFLGIFAEGGIVTRPTIGLVGEAGPEAIIPLSKAKQVGIGGNKTTYVDITIDTAVLNNPENIRDFTRFLREQLARES